MCDSEIPADELGCHEVRPGMTVAVELVLPPGIDSTRIGNSGPFTLWAQ